LSREEIAAIEVGHTDVSPVVARVLSVAFLLLIVTIPAVQNIHEFRAISREKAEAAKAGKEYTGPELPQCFDGLTLWPTRDELAGVKDFKSFLHLDSRMLKEINEFEDELEDNSTLQKALNAPAQYVLTGWFKGGNEKAYCGKGPWLFFRPGIDYLTGRGFLDPAVLQGRSQSGNEWTAPPQPDPVKAIVDFHDQLAERGIELVIMPTPVKPMIHPEKFSGRFKKNDTALQNPSFSEFKTRLAAKGVKVFDVAPDLVALKKKLGQDVYLESDTHWAPEGMQHAAGKLATFISSNIPSFQSSKPQAYGLTATPVSNIGDIAFMLKLPEGQKFYQKQKTTITRVLTSDGKPWAPDEAADVLLLGDSFSNIYSLEGMNWGSSAGFVEHVSVALGRPIDRIVINDSGAFSTRLNLGRDLMKGKDRLAGKKVVIWQFAARELAVGDWKLISMKLGKSKAGGSPKTVGGLVLKGKIAAMPKPPVPGQVPYKDATIGVHLTELQLVRGKCDLEETTEMLVYMWVMRGNKLTPVARYKVGQQVQLNLKPWDDVRAKVGGYNRLEIDDPMVLMLDAYWGEE